MALHPHGSKLVAFIRLDIFQFIEPFAFLTGTWNLNYMVISPAVGSWINYEFVGVNKNDLSGYPTLCLIAFFGALLSFALLPLVPTKTNIREWRKTRFKQDEERSKNRERRRMEREDEERRLL